MSFSKTLSLEFDGQIQEWPQGRRQVSQAMQRHVNMARRLNFLQCLVGVREGCSVGNYHDLI